MSAFFFPKVYQYAIWRLKWGFCLRGIHSSKVAVLSSTRGLQGQVPAGPDHSDPQFFSASVTWLFLTFALTWHQNLGKSSFPIIAAKGLCPKLAWGWGPGRRVWGKGKGEFISWLSRTALAQTKLGWGKTTPTSLWTGFRKGLFNQHSSIICN